MSTADGGAAGIRAVLLGLVFAVGIAAWAPLAFAQTIVSPNPAVLRWDQLNGARITLQAPTRFSFSAALDNRWSASGAPAGMTVSVVTAPEPKLTNGRTRANLVIQATGSFTRDWNLSIIAGGDAIQGRSQPTTFGPILVRAPPPSVTLSPSAATVMSAVNITERGARKTYPVQLGTRPTGNVNVQIRVEPTGSAVSTNISGMVFTTSNWNTARTVEVRARSDDNVVSETVRIRHSVLDAQSSSDYRPAPDAVLTVNVTDADTPAILVSQRGPVTLTEGQRHIYTMRLAYRPSGDVVVGYESSDAGAVTVDGTPSGQSDLTFTTGNWNTAQAITLDALHDDDLTDETVRIPHAIDLGATVADYDRAAAVTFAVTVRDDDGLVVLPRAVTVPEGQPTAAVYTVALKSQPTGAVTVTPSVPSGAATAVTVTPSALLFTGGATGNWASAQAVTVTAGPGATDADAADETVLVSHPVTSAMAPYNYAAQAAEQVTVTVDDAETAALVLSRTEELPVREGTEATYTVRLNAPPAVGSVQVTVTTGSTAVTVNQAGGTAGSTQTLTFSATTWQTGQVITVAAVEDANAAHEAVTLTHAVVDAASSDEYDPVANVQLEVAVTDDEGPEIVVTPRAPLTLTEGSTTMGVATHTVALKIAPTGTVVVAVTSSDGGAVTVNGAGTQNLTFTTSTWNTAQPVTVAAVTDTDALHERVTVTHAVVTGSSATDYHRAPAVPVAVTVTDNNAGLSVYPRAVTVQEGTGTGAPYTVELSTAPTGPVTVSVSVTATTIAVMPSTLLFSAATWNTPQTVTVTPTAGANDIDGVDPPPTPVSHAVSSSDAAYTYAARAAEQVSVQVEDDETPGVSVSRLALTVQEDPTAGGGTNRHIGTYTMRLTSGISGTGAVVGVQVTSLDRDAVQVRTAGDPFTPGSGLWRVNFTPQNWNVPQLVTVIAQADADGRDEVVTINNQYYAFDGNARNQGYRQAFGGADPLGPVANTVVTVVDDETPALVVDTEPATAGVQRSALAVREGSTTAALYTIALAVVPTETVSVTVANGDATAVTVAPTGLTFTTTTWSTAQTVTATATANDADGEHETVAVTHTLTGASEYTPPALPAAGVPGVTIQVTDDDAASARIYTSTPSPLVQAGLNGATVGVEVTNTTWASGVQVGSAVGNYFALDTSVPGLTLDRITSVDSTTSATLRLAYTGTAFNTARALTVRVLAAAHGGSDALTTNAWPVTPTPGLTIAPTTGLRTTESGGTAVFTVRLATEPAGDVVLDLASDNTAEGTVAPTTLTFAPAAWQTAQPVTLTGVDDAAATPPNPADGTQTYRITLTVDQTNTADATYDGMDPVRVTAMNQDNEFGLAVGSVTGQATEAGGTAAFTVALQTQPTGSVTVAVASQDTGEGVAAPGQLVFTPMNWETGQTVTVTGQDDDVDDEDQTYAIRLTPSSSDTNYNALMPEDVTVTTTDDETRPTVTLAVSNMTITEAGGVTTVTATLSGKSSEAVRLTVTTTAAAPAGAGDFTQSGTVLTIAAGATTSTGTVTVTAVDNDVDSPDKTVRVTAAAAGGHGVASPAALTVTLTDDDATPTVTLAVSPTAITETGGVATVTATLNRASSAATTVTVTTTAVAASGAVAGDFTQSGTVLTITAGQTASTGTVTLTATDNAVDAPDKTVRVTGTAGNAHGITQPSAVRLTLTDDDAAPTVTLAAAPAAITEEGGVTTVTATLNRASSAATTITVTAAPVAASGAAAGDFTLSPTTVLTVAAGQTASTGMVTLTANGNAVDAPAKTVRVTGTAANAQGITQPAAVDVTLTDDEALPTVTLAVSPTAVTEDGGVATVTATLSGESSQAVTLTVTATAVSPAVAADFTLSMTPVLTIAAGSTTSTGTVTVTAADNAVDAAAKAVTLAATAAGGNGVAAPVDVTLTLTDDDTAGVVADPTTGLRTTEGGRTATFTVRLATEPTGAVVLGLVSTNTAEGTVAPATLTFAAADWATAKPVTLTGVDDASVDGTQEYRVTLTVNQGSTADAVYDAVGPVTVTAVNQDNEYGLDVSAVTGQATEGGGTSAFTVALQTQPTADVTVAVASQDTSEGVAAPARLMFTPTTWTMAQPVTVTGQDDDVADGDVAWAVRLTTTSGDTNYHTLTPEDVTVTTTDDETLPTVTLAASNMTITEAGGVTTVTATLSGKSSQAVRLTVAATAAAPAVAGDFTQSGTVLTIAAETTTSTGTVTLTAVDNAVDAPDKTVEVTATAAGGNGVAAPAAVPLTLTDDDAAPRVEILYSAYTISENGGTTTVTATLSHPSSAATTVTAHRPTLETDRITVPMPGRLVIAAGVTTSPDAVVITAVDNAVDAPNYGTSVNWDMANAQGLASYRFGQGISITDDDATPTVTLAVSSTTLTEEGGAATVTATLNRASSAATTVTVTAAPVAASGAAAGDFTQSGTVLAIAAGQTASTGTVTLTAVGNALDAPNKTVRVTGTASNTHGITQPSAVEMTLTDDEALPTVTLAVTPMTIPEAAGVARVTATLSGASGQAVTLTVATTAVSPAVSADFTQSGTTLLIAAGTTASTGAVTLTATDDTRATGTKPVTISVTTAGGHGVTNPADATLTITDDDAPQATLVLTPTTIAETGGVATVTAMLDRQSASPVTVTVSATAGTGAVAGDFTLSTAPLLTFAANATTSSGVVTITAVNNETDAPDKRVTVSGVATDGAGLTNDPPAVTLTITDDDPAPNAALTLNPASIAENGGVATVTATLSRPSSASTTVTVTQVAGAYTVGTGAAATIVLAAGATTNATDYATVTGVDDAIYQGAAGRTATVTATLTNSHSQGMGTVTGATLTLTDSRGAPMAVLAVTPTAITEAGGVARVTATLSGPSSQPTTLTVAAAAGTGAVAGDFTLSTATVLTIAAGATTSTGTVTVTAVDNAVDLPDKQVTVTATAAGGHGVAAPNAAALTLTDDDVAGLTLDPVTSMTLTRRLRTSEDGDTATVRVRLATAPTATVVLDLASSATTEGTVAPATLTFTAMTWNTAQPVTLTGVDDDMATPPNQADGNQDYTVTLTANASSTTDDTYDSVMATVYATNRDNEFGLDAGDVTGPATEAGGTATFPVALLTNPGAAVTVAVASQDPSEGTVTPSVLVFTPDPSGTWPTPQTVTVTGVDDAVDDGDVRWTVRLTTTSSAGTNYDGLDEDVAVTTRDNDDAPTVTLVLTPPAITENGGVATVTATLAYASSEATAVTVTATPVAPAVTGDYTLSTTTVLTIAAGALTSEGTVTITAENNHVDAPNKTVTVAGNAANARASRDGMQVAVTAATLTLTDDDERGFAFNPATLVLAAGGTTAYTVALTSMPTGPVTVTLTPDAAVTVDPTSLPFTTMNWNTVKTVMLTVAADTTASANQVEHVGAGSDYEGTTQFLAVTRMTVPRIETTEPIETRDEPEGRCDVRNGLLECLYFRNDQLVTVMRPTSNDVTLGVTFTPDAPLTRPLTLAVRPLDEVADEVADAAGRRFRLGLALDVTVTPSLPGRLCLPVRQDVRRAAGSRRVHLLHTPNPDGDGMWTSLAAVAPDDPLCAHIPSTSPFAVGYENLGINFAEDAQTLFPFRTGQEVNQPLPGIEMAGHPDLTYTLLPADLPAGLRHDTSEAGVGHGGTLVGTPTAPMTAPYRLRAVDGDKNMAELSITIKVEPGIERRDLALVLAGVGRTLASDAVEILGSRTGPPPARLHVTLGGQVLRLTAPAQAAPAAAPAASGPPSPLASAPSPLAGEGRGEGADAVAPAATPDPSPWQRVTGVAVGVARALGVTLDTPALPAAGGAQSEDSTFPSAQTLLARAPADPRRPASPTWRSPLSLQPVSAKDLLARSAFELPLTRTDADGLPTWTVWGRGAASGFAGQPEEGFKMDGTLYSGYLGLDYRQASLLMGLAVAHSTGTVDYERTGGTTAGVDVQLTSLLPYAHWQPRPGLGLWGLLGAGWGEMDLKAVGDPATYTTALTSWLGAVGGRQALTTWQGIDLAAKTDAFLTTLRSEAKTNLPGARGHAERVRLLLEGQTAVALSPVSQVQPRLEVGGRWDSGTAEQGLGLELGGGLAYTQTEWGLSVDMQGRYLLVHEDGAFEDWGASVNVRLDPGLGGEGAYLTVAPVWGQPGSGVEQLWGQAAAVPGGPPAARAAGWRPANVEIDVGYGLALADGRGLLTPYGGLVLGDPGTARYRLGSRWALSTLLDLSVEGERAEQPGQASAHSVSVRLGWQW